MEKPFWLTWKLTAVAAAVSIMVTASGQGVAGSYLLMASLTLVPLISGLGARKWDKEHKPAQQVANQSENSEQPLPVSMDLRKCPKCAELIQQDAVFCKHCHSKVPVGTSGTAVKRPPSKATWVVAAVLLMALFGALLDHQETQSNAETAAATVVSAADLYADYHTNEIDADSRYKGQRLKVSGVLNGIKKGIGDEAYL